MSDHLHVILAAVREHAILTFWAVLLGFVIALPLGIVAAMGVVADLGLQRVATPWARAR